MKALVGRYKNSPIVEGDINLIQPGEIHVSKAEGYTVITKKVNGKKESSVLIPIKEIAAYIKKSEAGDTIVGKVEDAIEENIIETEDAKEKD